MKIGLWNIDHPEKNFKRASSQKRFLEVTNYLHNQECDLFILTESNSAIELPGFNSFFSDESPFTNQKRCYAYPNRYHQVSILSKLPVEQLRISEPINGVLCKIRVQGQPILLYGNVITIKDQWKKDSNKKYNDRLEEQISQFTKFLDTEFIVAGDFNLKKGWIQKKAAYTQIENFVSENNLHWPTSEQTSSVQQVIHSTGINVMIEADFSVKHEEGKKNSLSDHPFYTITIA